MTILYISDSDPKSSGYSNIMIALCTQLAQRGYDVIVLGISYNGEEHHYPFRIVPLPGLEYVAPMISQFKAQGLEIEALIVALDIPLQEALLARLPQSDFPYIGLFPLEAPPLCPSWAMSLMQMDARLVMSQFGAAECERMGVTPTQFIPIGVDTEAWKAPEPEVRAKLRQGLGLSDDTFAVLTVADNQERKNLSRAFEIFADFTYGFEVLPTSSGWQPSAEQLANRRKTQYMLVSRLHSPVGWKLQDLAMEYHILDRFVGWDRGIPFSNLWALFAAADAFLLTSKAEGLAMPVLEAMAMRLPVVGTDCAAIAEHLCDEGGYSGRGYLIKPDYIIIDPFGNGYRYMASRESGISHLNTIASEADFLPVFKQSKLDAARTYTEARTWDKAGDVLIEAIEQGREAKRQRVAGMPIHQPLEI